MQTIKKLTHESWLEIGYCIYGPDSKDFEFKCCGCGKIQSVRDFIDLGMAKKKIESIIGQDCIGRYNGKGRPFFIGRNINEDYSNGCDWSVENGYPLHIIEIAMPDRVQPIFDFSRSENHSLN